jgi:hypothetical protein
MKFIVEYSSKKDLIPYLMSFRPSLSADYGRSDLEYGKKYFPVEFINSVKNAKTTKDAENVVIKYWQSIRSKHFDQDTDFFIKWYSRILNEEIDLIIKPLEKVYLQKFPFSEVTVYLTTFFCCPYNFNEKWYMTYRNSNIYDLIYGSIHELNHFMFYYYWRDYLKKQKISFKKTEYLKESLAILTSFDSKENDDKPNILDIQNFVKLNKDKPIKEIIDLTINECLLK